MTTKQQKVYDVLVGMGSAHPTARSLTDRMDERYHRSERWTEGEVRGLLRRLASGGHVEQFKGPKGENRYKAAA